MKKWLYQSRLFLLYGLVWMILNEKLSLLTFVIGGLLGIFTVMFTENILTFSNYMKAYDTNPILMLKYFFYLIYQIYYSGFSAVRMIWSGHVNPDIVTIETDLKDDFKKCILANSITLTPGTVTLDIEENRLKVLWINCLTKDSKEAGEKIKGKLERKLLKG